MPSNSTEVPLKVNLPHGRHGIRLSGVVVVKKDCPKKFILFLASYYERGKLL